MKNNQIWKRQDSSRIWKFAILGIVLILLIVVIVLEFIILGKVNDFEVDSVASTDQTIKTEGAVSIEDNRKASIDSSIGYDLELFLSNEVTTLHRQNLINSSEVNNYLDNIGSNDLSGQYVGTFIFDKDANLLLFNEDTNMSKISDSYTVEISFFNEDVDYRNIFIKHNKRWVKFNFGKDWNFLLTNYLADSDLDHFEAIPTRLEFNNHVDIVSYYSASHVIEKTITFNGHVDILDGEIIIWEGDVEDQSDENQIFYANTNREIITDSQINWDSIWWNMPLNIISKWPENWILPILNENFLIGTAIIEIDIDNDQINDYTVYLDSTKNEEINSLFARNIDFLVAPIIN